MNGSPADRPWVRLDDELLSALLATVVPKRIETRQGHVIEYDEMSAAGAKSAIDKVDQAFAEHFGFTDEQVDRLINYDIKYRMGQEAADEE